MGYYPLIGWTEGPPPFLNWEDVGILTAAWFWAGTVAGIIAIALGGRRVSDGVLVLDVLAIIALVFNGAIAPIPILLFSQAICAALRDKRQFLRKGFILLVVLDGLIVLSWAMSEWDYFRISHEQAGAPIIKIPAELDDGLLMSWAYLIVFSIATAIWAWLHPPHRHAL